MDCLGNNHLVYDTIIYQVFYDREKLQLLHPANTKSFENFLLPCVGEDSYNLYLNKRYGSGDLTDQNWYPVAARDSVMDYYIVNKTTKLKSDLTTIADPQAIEINMDLVKWIDKKEKDGLYIAPIDSGMGNMSNRDYIRRSRSDAGLYIPPHQKTFDYLFAQQVMFKELYAPLFVVNDTVYIFNYQNSKIQCYYFGDLFHEIEIRFHKDKNCNRQILMDKKNNRIYAVFESNSGLTSLKEISLVNGSIKNSYDVPTLRPEKLHIYDNYIYYLRTKSGENVITSVIERVKIN